MMPYQVMEKHVMLFNSIYTTIDSILTIISCSAVPVLAKQIRLNLRSTNLCMRNPWPWHGRLIGLTRAISGTNPSLYIYIHMYKSIWQHEDLSILEHHLPVSPRAGCNVVDSQHPAGAVSPRPPGPSRPGLGTDGRSQMIFNGNADQSVKHDGGVFFLKKKKSFEIRSTTSFFMLNFLAIGAGWPQVPLYTHACM